jgi:hypothetical protein
MGSERFLELLNQALKLEASKTAARPPAMLQEVGAGGPWENSHKQLSTTALDITHVDSVGTYSYLRRDCHQRYDEEVNRTLETELAQKWDHQLYHHLALISHSSYSPYCP